MQAWIFGMAAWWLILYLRGKASVTPALLHARPVILLLFFWLLLVAFQLLPLPGAIVGFLSPGSLALFAATSSQQASADWVTISTVPYESADFLLESISYVLLFILSLLLLRHRRRLRLLITVLVLTGVFQAVYGGVMVLSGLEYGFFFEKESFQGRATGTFINRNHLAGYLEMCLAAGIGLLLADMKPGGATTWRQRFRNMARWLLSPKIRLRVFLAVMVVGLVLSRSRMGNTAFFSSLIVSGGVWLLLAGKRPKRSAMILLVSIFLIDIYIVGEWFGLDKVVERLQRTEVEITGVGGIQIKSDYRSEVARDAIEITKDYPLFGSGGGTFNAVFPGYRGEDNALPYRYVHNDYIQIASETGLLGLGLLGSVVLLSMVTALRAIYRRRDSLMRGLGFAGFMGGLSLMIHSTVDFNLQIPANAALFMLILSFSWIGMGKKSAVRGQSRG
ncbi:MAG: O-antigen ligase family protein [Gammaproteobacteria bacterium]|nr:O-antigen ligase family protein [Gammaproteobacteria bacterium]